MDVLSDEQDFIKEECAKQVDRNIMLELVEKHGAREVLGLLVEAVLDKAQRVRDFSPPIPEFEQLAQQYEALAGSISITQQIVREPGVVGN